MNYKLLIINYPMRSYTKKELAQLAGVSDRTFNRWMARHRRELEAMGVGLHTHILPPRAVRYICEIYFIDAD
ncbi:hypothetical protein [Xylanibacter caecicola]|uniref:hypothetical protein n=1 Tax=Xylanibacter caecicola TaxID=2736294 RepID=UPI00258C9ECF|nr:hypothetical protein [Xylanibacter caecicola]